MDGGSFRGALNLFLCYIAPDTIRDILTDGAAEQNPSTHGEMKSVVDPEMQYITHENFGEELYNWRTDPQEMDNLINDPAAKTVVDVFRSYLNNLVGELFKKP